MNGSTENMASGRSQDEFHCDYVFSLSLVQRMLPLVRRIVADVQDRRRHLARVRPELSNLDRHRRDLVWLERRRRYQLQDETTRTKAELQDAVQELLDLGVTVLNESLGRVGFPTIVNNRAAYFSWQPGEEAPQYWQFFEEAQCRPIPEAWLEEIQVGAER